MRSPSQSHSRSQRNNAVGSVAKDPLRVRVASTGARDQRLTTARVLRTRWLSSASSISCRDAFSAASILAASSALLTWAVSRTTVPGR